MMVKLVTADGHEEIAPADYISICHETVADGDPTPTATVVTAARDSGARREFRLEVDSGASLFVMNARGDTTDTYRAPVTAELEEAV